MTTQCGVDWTPSASDSFMAWAQSDGNSGLPPSADVTPATTTACLDETRERKRDRIDQDRDAESIQSEARWLSSAAEASKMKTEPVRKKRERVFAQFFPRAPNPGHQSAAAAGQGRSHRTVFTGQIVASLPASWMALFLPFNVAQCTILTWNMSQSLVDNAIFYITIVGTYLPT